MKITKRSPLTGELNIRELNVSEEQLRRWKAGELIQDVMPQLSASEREFLITGYTQEDWDKMFGDEDEEI